MKRLIVFLSLVLAIVLFVVKLPTTQASFYSVSQLQGVYHYEDDKYLIVIPSSIVGTKDNPNNDYQFKFCWLEELDGFAYQEVNSYYNFGYYLSRGDLSILDNIFISLKYSISESYIDKLTFILYIGHSALPPKSFIKSDYLYLEGPNMSLTSTPFANKVSALKEVENSFTDGFSNGYNSGLADGFWNGWYDGIDKGKIDGFIDGKQEGINEVLRSLEAQGILYHDITLPNGVKDEIVDNSKLIDRVGYLKVDNIAGFAFVSYNDKTIFIRATNYVSNNAVKDTQTTTAVSNYLIQSYNHSTNTDKESFFITSLNHLFIRLDTSRLENYSTALANVDKMQLVGNYFKDNPLIIHYQLAEPKEYNLIPLLTNADGSYDVGYLEGFNNGKQVGLKDVESTLNFGSLLGSIFASLGVFLGINLLPGISIGAIIAVPLVFGIIAFIIGRKKE